jgi:hypothetical protein
MPLIDWIEPFAEAVPVFAVECGTDAGSAGGTEAFWDAEPGVLELALSGGELGVSAGGDGGPPHAPFAGWLFSACTSTPCE